jgi:hypothetical protein
MALTPKQLDRKAKQLFYRRRLAETLESLEESIKAHMEVEDKAVLVTKNFIIRLEENRFSISPLPRADPRQLKLEFEENI